MNIIFNELRQQNKNRYTLFLSHIIFIANLSYFNWNYFVMRD